MTLRNLKNYFTQNKPDMNGYLLYNFFHIKFKNRFWSRVLEIRPVVVYGNEDGLKQGMSKCSWVISLFSNLTGVVVAQMYTHIKNHQVAHLRPMRFTACKGFKKKKKTKNQANIQKNPVIKQGRSPRGERKSVKDAFLRVVSSMDTHPPFTGEVWCVTHWPQVE